MYENKKQKIISQTAFVWRLAWHILAALLLILIMLTIGALGHIHFEDVDFHDAFLNTALIMGGIGTTVLPTSIADKLFFSIFGMFVGFLFAAIVGMVLAPIVHRIVHRMHLDDED